MLTCVFFFFFLGVQDISGLLNSAKFKLVTLDTDTITVEYPSVFSLMTDLQNSGDSNAILTRKLGPIGKDILIATDSIYNELYPAPDGEGIVASFDIIYLIGWKESPDQQKPLPRGSGERNLKDLFDSK